MDVLIPVLISIVLFLFTQNLTVNFGMQIQAKPKCWPKIRASPNFFTKFDPGITSDPKS